MTPRMSWTDESISKEVHAAMRRLGVVHMPSANELRSVGMGRVASAIARRGGFDRRADMLSLEPKPCASRTGWEWEHTFVRIATSRGLPAARSRKVKHPWDVMCAGVTVDVKVANRGVHHLGSPQWTWRVGREQHVCDVYALFALGCDGDSYRLFIVPAAQMPLTSRTMMREDTRHLDNWDVFSKKGKI